MQLPLLLLSSSLFTMSSARVNAQLQALSDTYGVSRAVRKRKAQDVYVSKSSSDFMVCFCFFFCYFSFLLFSSFLFFSSSLLFSSFPLFLSSLAPSLLTHRSPKKVEKEPEKWWLFSLFSFILLPPLLHLFFNNSSPLHPSPPRKVSLFMSKNECLGNMRISSFFLSFSFFASLSLFLSFSFFSPLDEGGTTIL